MIKDNSGHPSARYVLCGTLLQNYNQELEKITRIFQYYKLLTQVIYTTKFLYGMKHVVIIHLLLYCTFCMKPEESSSMYFVTLAYLSQSLQTGLEVHDIDFLNWY